MSKQVNIPTLRFPEFNGEWEKKKLGEVAEIIMGQSPDGDSYNIIGEGIPLINGPVEFTEKYPVKIKWTSKPTKYCQDKDVLFCVRGSTTGRMNIANDKYCIGRGVAAIRANKLSTSLFVELILIKNLEGILSYTTGSTFQNIDSKSLKEFQSNFPTLPEQTKIANFLTAVDEKLQTLKKKKSGLENYKKGVMQRLFSQTLRFKDENGKGFPDWEVKKLGEVCEQLSSGKDKPNESDLYPIYGSMGIIGYSSNFSYSKKSILIARVGANAGTINIVEGNYGVTDNTLVLMNKSNIEINYLFYLLIYQDLNKLVFGSGQPLITAGQLKSINLGIPSLPEQTLIANFLSAIDDKINKTNTQLTQTETWKKGLLQKMFV
jgi:type I restriction enzyme, S subunit